MTTSSIRWDLAYLKFCCKVQGIRNELFANDVCKVSREEYFISGGFVKSIYFKRFEQTS